MWYYLSCKFEKFIIFQIFKFTYFYSSILDCISIVNMFGNYHIKHRRNFSFQDIIIICRRKEVIYVADIKKYCNTQLNDLIHDVLTLFPYVPHFVWHPCTFHQLFGTWNERNSIRNIEVNVPSREVSKAMLCTLRLRKEGTRGCWEDRGEAEGNAVGECAAKVEDALQWVPRQRARSVWLSAFPWAVNKVLTCGSHLALANVMVATSKRG